MFIAGMCASFLVGGATAKLVAHFLTNTVSAQICSPPGFGNATPKPSDLFTAGWRINSTVLFGVSELPFSPVNINAQAIQALNTWGATTTCLHIGFIESSFTDLHFESAPTLNQSGDCGLSSQDDYDVDTEATLEATIRIATAEPSCVDLSDPNGRDTYFKKLVLHEVGHTMGLGDTTGPSPGTGLPCGGQVVGGSVMNLPTSTNDTSNCMALTPKPCDIQKVNEYNTPEQCCTGNQKNPHTECSGFSCDLVNSCGYDQCTLGSYCETCSECINDYFCENSCSPNVDCAGGQCDILCPIVIDVQGNGFNLTDASGGVTLDLSGDGTTERVAWTSGGSDDAWLEPVINFSAVFSAS